MRDCICIGKEFNAVNLIQSLIVGSILATNTAQRSSRSSVESFTILFVTPEMTAGQMSLIAILLVNGSDSIYKFYLRTIRDNDHTNILMKQFLVMSLFILSSEH